MSDAVTGLKPVAGAGKVVTCIVLSPFLVPHLVPGLCLCHQPELPLNHIKLADYTGIPEVKQHILVKELHGIVQSGKDPLFDPEGAIEFKAHRGAGGPRSEERRVGTEC